MTKTKKKYPNFVKWSSNEYESLEQVDGVPDFKVIRLRDDMWHVKWRTSAKWEAYQTKEEAFDSIKDNLKIKL